MNAFEIEITVRSYECDIYQHVNNATYLNYFEHARVALLNKMGFSLNSLMKNDIILPIVNINIDYKTPATEGDVLILSIEWIKRGKTSSTFHQKIIRKNDNTLICKADITWVAANRKGKPIPLPQLLINKYQETIGSVLEKPRSLAEKEN
jgi:YbgC/YbaW family acyl-CoA thioester hydrolase